MSTTLNEFAEKLAAALDRTPSGKPTAEVRAKNGVKTGPQQGKFPIADKKSAISAINKRHSAKPPLTKQELNTLLTRAAKFAPDEAAAARAKDKADGKL